MKRKPYDIQHLSFNDQKIMSCDCITTYIETKCDDGTIFSQYARCRAGVHRLIRFDGSDRWFADCGKHTILEMWTGFLDIRDRYGVEDV